jgi:hypothetical protein
VARDPVGPGDLAQTEPALSIVADRSLVQFQRLAPDVAALELGAPHPGAHPLDDQRALQLGDGADDHDHGSAQGAAGVEVLAEADELDVQPVQLVEYLQEVAHRAGQSVAGPDHDDVETSAAGLGHQLVKARPANAGAAKAVIGVLGGDLVTPLLGQEVEIVQLGLGVLIESRDAHVKGSSLHGWWSWQGSRST